MVEQRAGTAEQLAIREANMGLYCYLAAPFWQHIRELRTDNPAHEYYLTADMVEVLHRHAKRTRHQSAAPHRRSALEVLGINDRAELAVVDRLLRERKVRELMLAGVTVEKPETVTVDPDVTIGMDTIVEPFAQILGRTARSAKTAGQNQFGCSVITDSELTG